MDQAKMEHLAGGSHAEIGPAYGEPPPEHVLCLGAAVQEMAESIDRALRRSVRLNHYEFLLMQALYDHPEGVQLRLLDRMLHCSHQRTAIAVARLEGRELVAVAITNGAIDDVARHRKAVLLTENGLAKIESARPVYLSLVRELTARRLSIPSDS